MQKNRMSARSGTKFKRRVHGTPRQMGKAFPITPHRSRKDLGKVNVSHPARTVELKLITVTPNDLILLQNPDDLYVGDFETRVQHFEEMIRAGKTIPPILVHRLPSGKLEVMDGYARIEAYRRKGITRYPAVENGIKEIFTKAFSGLKKGSADAKRMATNIYKSSAPKLKALGSKLLKFAKKIPAKTETALIKTSRALGRIEAVPAEMTEAFHEAKAERPWEEKGEIATHLEATPEEKVAEVAEEALKPLPEAEGLQEPPPRPLSYATSPFQSPNPLTQQLETVHEPVQVSVKGEPLIKTVGEVKAEKRRGKKTITIEFDD